MIISYDYNTVAAGLPVPVCTAYYNESLMRSSRRQFLACAGGAAIAAASARKARAGPGSGKFSRYDAAARQLLASLSLEEKIGQMTQPDQSFLRNIDDIEQFHLGSLLSGGDSDPKSGNDVISWTDLYDRYQSRALATRLRIPLLYGVDAVHGHNNVIGAVVFPHNIGLGCSRNTALVEKAARITSEEVRATGINWAFAPCVAAPQDIRWGRTYEGFSEDPAVVRELGAAAVRGLQRESLRGPLSVLACAKHFAGDGGTSFGTGIKGRLDQGDTRVDEATLRRIHLPGYVAAIEAGVGSIMPSYSSWNGEKASGSRRLLMEILKGELDFEGFLISDYAAVDQLPGTYKEQIARSINAGMDMVMVPEKYQNYFTNLHELVNEGIVSQARIDDAVVRILRVKLAMGLMDQGRPVLADRSLHRGFGSPDHRAVARDCVRQSLVVLTNNGHVLPLARTAARIHVAGRNADDIGNQCGGWTIRWQGSSGEDTLGTTVVAGLRDAVSPATKVTYSRDGSGAAGASVGVAVIGETPYAEMNGDRVDLRLAPEDVATVTAMKSAGVPVVAVLVSGRPLLIDDILGPADAIVAAWLPGTEGAGVADVLLGNARPSGRLSFTWPRGISASYHKGDPDYRTLFPFGHGLTW